MIALPRANTPHSPRLNGTAVKGKPAHPLIQNHFKPRPGL
jgi:hypothetical protein